MYHKRDNFGVTQVNAHNMGVKLWPRGAALAENLWSAPDSRLKSTYARLAHHTNRMINLGIKTDQLQPESCYRFNGHCTDPTHPMF